MQNLGYVTECYQKTLLQASVDDVTDVVHSYVTLYDFTTQTVNLSTLKLELCILDLLPQGNNRNDTYNALEIVEYKLDDI